MKATCKIDKGQPTLICKTYFGAGVFQYGCSKCKAIMSFSTSLHYYYTTATGKLTKDFPIKYCWNCGKKFTRFQDNTSL